VVVGLDMPKGKKTLEVAGVFADGAMVNDYYSGQKLMVSAGKVMVDSEWGIVLLGLIKPQNVKQENRKM